MRGQRRRRPTSITNNNSSADDSPDVEVSDNTITGPLTCTGNTASVTNEGSSNTVTGPESGQCAGL